MDDVLKLFFVMLTIMGLPIALIYFVVPLAKAFTRRIEGKSLDGDVLAELDQLRLELAELRGLPERLAEVEERVDFTERLLARHDETARAALPEQGTDR